MWTLSSVWTSWSGCRCTTAAWRRFRAKLCVASTECKRCKYIARHWLLREFHGTCSSWDFAFLYLTKEHAHIVDYCADEKWMLRKRVLVDCMRAYVCVYYNYNRIQAAERECHHESERHQSGWFAIDAYAAAGGQYDHTCADRRPDGAGFAGSIVSSVVHNYTTRCVTTTTTKNSTTHSYPATASSLHHHPPEIRSLPPPSWLPDPLITIHKLAWIRIVYNLYR